MVQIGKIVSENIRFEFLYVHDLAQGQEMTLTFNTHIPSYIQLDDCSYSLAAIVSEKSIVFTISHRKAEVTKFDLAVK